MMLRSMTALGALAAAAPALAGPLDVSGKVLVEQRVAAADGTTRTTLAAPGHVVPGDHVVFVLAYRNTGRQPIADLVLANPVPAGMAYRGAQPGSVAPELSVDGRSFAALATLRVRAATGTRAARPDDVTTVRWRLASPLPAGAQGQFAFQAVVK